MKDFCRTCGQTIVPEECLQIFSQEGRQLLHCVRSITNCWVGKHKNPSGTPDKVCLLPCSCRMTRIHRV